MNSRDAKNQGTKREITGGGIGSKGGGAGGKFLYKLSRKLKRL